MLEILGIMFLCAKNAKNAQARGRKPGLFIFLTILLWLGGEMVGMMLGGMLGLEMLPSYGMGIALAVIGAVSSYFIAKNAKQGDYVPPAAKALGAAQALAAPATVHIVRDKSAVGAMVSYSFTLNGQPVGELKNGADLQAGTHLAQNMLVGKDLYGNDTKPLYFTVPPGGAAEIHFSGGRFLPERCMGCTVMSDAEAAPYVGAGSVPVQMTGGAVAPVYAGAAGIQAVGGGAPLQPALPENPMRAVFTAGAGLLGILLFALVWPLGGSYDLTGQIHYLCFLLVLSSSAYLLMQPGMYKGIAAVALVLGAVLEGIMGTYLRAWLQMWGRPRFVLVFENGGLLWNNLLNYLITALIVGGVALLFSLLDKNGDNRKKLFKAVWIASAVVAVQYVINMRWLFMGVSMMPAYRIVFIVLDSLVGAATIGLFAMLVWFLCNLKSKTIEHGTGAKVWMGIVIFFSVGSTIGTIVMELGTPATVVVALVVIAGYFLLIFRRRVGFAIVLLGVAVNVLANLGSAMTGPEPSVFTMITALVGGVNPLITWLLIMKNWPVGVQAPAAVPVAAGVPGAAGAVAGPAVQPVVAPVPARPVQLRQMCSFIATTHFTIDPNTEKGKQYANQIHPFAVRQLQKQSPTFTHKYGEAMQKGLPHKIGFGTAMTKEGLNQSFKAWVAREGITAEDLNALLGRTLFMKEGQVPDPVSGQDRDWMVYILFVEG